MQDKEDRRREIIKHAFESDRSISDFMHTLFPDEEAAAAMYERLGLKSREKVIQSMQSRKNALNASSTELPEKLNLINEEYRTTEGAIRVLQPLIQRLCANVHLSLEEGAAIAASLNSLALRHKTHFKGIAGNMGYLSFEEKNPSAGTKFYINGNALCEPLINGFENIELVALPLDGKPEHN